MSLHIEALDSETHARDTAKYMAAEKAFKHLQTTSMFTTLPVLQGRVLMLAYEIGHALYPEAFINIAVCVQLATAMGLGFETSDASQQCSTEVDLMSEGKRRTWWAIYLLER